MASPPRENYRAYAVVHKYRRPGKGRHWKERLPSSPAPTNQRAEFLAITLALQKALEQYEKLDNQPRLKVKIHSDSKYAIGCMTEWVGKWKQNDWKSVNGKEVANKELIEEADGLHGMLRELGSVRFIWIPREENAEADRLCNDLLAMMKKERKEKEQEQLKKRYVIFFISNFCRCRGGVSMG